MIADSRAFEPCCARSPTISSRSCAIRFCSWLFCPSRAVRRASNSVCSAATSRTTAGSERRPASSAGHSIVARLPPRPPAPARWLAAPLRRRSLPPPPRRPPPLKQRVPGRPKPPPRGIRAPPRQLRRPLHRGPPVPLRLQPRLARGELVELLGDHLQVRPRDRLVEPDQQIPLGHPVALPHLELAHDAPCRVLHLQIGRAHV